jgi:TolB-like protein/DNA-binding winged helix-turn-helix (wHTH) protein
MRDVPGSDGLKAPREAASLIRFAGLVLDLDAFTFVRESGEAIPLTRGEFALLRVFVTRPGRVVSRDALLDGLANRRFEPFDRSVDVLVGRLRRKIEPNPKKPCLIVTVPGEGYRFDGFTRTLQSDQKPSIDVPASKDDEGRPDPDSWLRAPSENGAELDLAAIEIKPPSPAMMTDHTRWQAAKRGFALIPLAAAIAALVLLTAVGVSSLLGGRLTNPLKAAHLSIVVLPFTNLSGDPNQDYFVDGVTENLTTELSRIRNSFVIARKTALTYKGRNVDAKQIGEELGVRYVLDGSLQRDDGRMRVNAQLVDVESAMQLWTKS